MAALTITGMIQREQHGRGKFATFFEYLIDDVGIDFRMRGQLLQLIVYMQ
jgi:hypothetical protein